MAGWQRQKEREIDAVVFDLFTVKKRVINALRGHKKIIISEKYIRVNKIKQQVYFKDKAPW